MFKKICIKKKELVNQKVDIAFLVDSMLFYETVIVLVHKEELLTLLEYFGEDFLKELIVSGRLELKIRENILGSMTFPNDKYNVELVAKQNESSSSIIYEAHRKFVNNSTKNIKFSDELSKITEAFRYSTNITEQIKLDFQNTNLLKQLLPVYIIEKISDFEIPDDLQIEIIKDSSFGPFDAYSLNSNIDIDKFNKKSKELYGDSHFDFNYSVKLIINCRI